MKHAPHPEFLQGPMLRPELSPAAVDFILTLVRRERGRRAALADKRPHACEPGKLDANAEKAGRCEWIEARLLDTARRGLIIVGGRDGR